MSNRFHFIDIGDINYDEQYKFSNTYFSEDLNHSITKLGIIKPICIFNENKNIRILSGHNRYKIAKSNNINLIPVVENNYKEYNFNNEIILKSYYGEINSISKLRYIKNCFDKNDVDNNVLKALKIPEKYKENRKIENVFLIQDELFQYIDKKNFNFKIIDEILNLRNECLEFLISMVKLKKLKSNIVKEIIYLLNELQRKNILPEFIQTEEKNIRKIEDSILCDLKKLNFSKYFETKNKVEDIISKYRQNNIKIIFPEYFEGNSLQFEINIQNENELNDIIKKLKLIDKKDLKNIFQMM